RKRDFGAAGIERGGTLGALIRLLGCVIKEGEHAIVVALRERVVFVVMALAALERRAQPYGPRDVDPIDHMVDAVFLFVSARLDVDRRAAMKAGGDLLVERCIR